MEGDDLTQITTINEEEVSSPQRSDTSASSIETTINTSNFVNDDIIGSVENSSNISQENEVSQEPVKKVIIGLPGNNFSSKFLMSLCGTIAEILSTKKYQILLAPGTGSLVHFVRMQTLGCDVLRGRDQKPFNGADYDVWVTIDSDIIFTPENFFELVESTDKHPVVSGMYRMDNLQHLCIVKDWDVNYFKKNGSFEFLTPEFVEKWKTETGLKFLPVHYTGLGFFACRKEVLDSLMYPYFNGDIREIGSSSGVVIRDMSSEDVNFCKNIHEQGFEIVVNTDLRVGHLKPLVI